MLFTCHSHAIFHVIRKLFTCYLRVIYVLFVCGVQVRRFLSDLLRIDPSERLTLRAAHDKHSLFKGGITLGPVIAHSNSNSIASALAEISNTTRKIEITTRNIDDTTRNIDGTTRNIDGTTRNIDDTTRIIDGTTRRIDDAAVRIEGKVDGIASALALLGSQWEEYSDTFDEALSFAREELTLDGNIDLLTEILAAVQEASGKCSLTTSASASLPGSGVAELMQALQTRIDLSLETAVSALSSESRSLAVALQSSVREGMQEMRSTVSSAVANANANAVAVAGAEVAAVAGEAEAGREAALVVQKQLTMLQNQVSQLHG